MKALTSLGPGPAPEIHEQFVDLVCADLDLMRAEFDAIVEAGWGGDESPPQPGQAQDTDEPDQSGRRPDSPDHSGRRSEVRTKAAPTDSIRRRPRSPPRGSTPPAHGTVDGAPVARDATGAPW
jgi:hypothetical protein